ncbi:MAG: hypothetical protein ACI92E_001454 [Oceanicoccus sp.]|jgi:hypothetical protein
MKSRVPGFERFHENSVKKPANERLSRQHANEHRTTADSTLTGCYPGHFLELDGI